MVYGLIYIIQERTALLPLATRFLYLTLFTEIRLLTRSVKRYVLSFSTLLRRIETCEVRLGCNQQLVGCYSRILELWWTKMHR
jgi:hypothetical protein